MLVLVTGNSGAGKTAVRGELRRRGYDAHDTDEDGLSSWRHRTTGGIAVRPLDPADRTAQWYAQHDWVLSRREVEVLADRADAAAVFLCGSPTNAEDLLDLFDALVFLAVDEDTLRRRLAARSGNDFGKAPDELRSILGWHHELEDRYRRRGAVVVDGARPLPRVADDVVSAVVGVT